MVRKERLDLSQDPNEDRWRIRVGIDLSVIIVSWNTCAMLRDCLGSIEDNSEDLDIETIVVDNGSKDESPEMVANEFPEVNLIRRRPQPRFRVCQQHRHSRKSGKVHFTCQLGCRGLAELFRKPHRVYGSQS